MADNKELNLLEALNEKVLQLQSEQKELIKNIREGFVKKTIVFIDMVGSTKFKVEHEGKPEIWILRNKQFSDLLNEIIKKCNGCVIKYIGDEVMASFDSTYDAQNLICRIKEIEEKLKEATGFETRIKTAIDYGLVYELNFDGHSFPDPHSSIVDRCARISKYSKAGEVVSSSSFVKETPSLQWKKVGKTNLKGLGLETIYQLGHVNVSIEEIIEVKKVDYEGIKEQLEDSKIENTQLKEKLKTIIEEFKSKGTPISKAALIKDESEEEWDTVEELIEKLRTVIYDAPGDSSDYARFLFLYYSKGVGDRYNKYEGRTFDALIETDLVEHVDGSIYELNTSHPRNDRAIDIINEIETELKSYLSSNDKDEDDLFIWSMKDAEFWGKYVGYHVV